MRRTRNLLVFLALSVFALGRCGGGATPAANDTPGGAEQGGAAPAGERRPARTLPIPGEPAIPPGHPPLETRKAGPLSWAVPENWEALEPTSSLRLAQYRVSGPAGDAECVVYYFGPGQGGDAQSNALRWASQFTGPDGEPATETMKVTELESARLPVSIVEITGTYDGGMTMTAAPSEKKSGYMLLGSIAQGTDAPWFFKLTGPEATVRAQRSAFVKMMESLQPGE